MAYDDLLRKISGKRFEIRMFIILLLNGFPNSFSFTSMALLLYTPKDFHCSLPYNASEHIAKNPLSKQIILDYLIPQDSTNVTRSKCLQYNRTTEEISMFLASLQSKNETLQPTESATLITCKMGHEFLEPVIYSAAMELDFTCERVGLKSLVILMYVAGLMLSSFAGYIPDRFGRRPIFIYLTFEMFVCLLVKSFTNSAWTFAGLSFLSGLFGLMNYLTGFVLGGELTTPERRNFISMSTGIGFVFGYGVTSFIFYVTPNWRWFLAVMGLLGIPYIANIWLIPESPRWLMANGRVNEAKKVLRMIAKYNRKPQCIIDDMINDVDLETKHLLEERSDSDFRLHMRRQMLKNVGRSPAMLLLLFVTAFSWFAIGLVYNVLSLGVQALGGNILINNALLGAVELPGSVLAFLAVKYISRPVNHGGFVIASGMCCLGTALLNSVSPLLSTIVSLVGKCFIAVAFYTVYLHTAEVYPTLIRNSCISISSLAGKMGGMFAPLLLLLVETQGIYFPYIIMSCIAVASGIFTILVFPETKDVPLPENTGDILKLKTIYGRCYRKIGRTNSPRQATINKKGDVRKSNTSEV